MSDFITIAKIVKPQGIRGELKVTCMTDSPEDLKAFDRVYVGGNLYKLLKVRPGGGECAFITLSGIADRNAAELMRDKLIEVMRSDMPALPEGKYYIVDIIGCNCVSDGGEALGKVLSVTPARTDIYEVERENGKKFTFPAAEGVILDVDLDNSVITLCGERLREVALGLE